MVGMILGAAMRLVTGGSKVAMEHFQAKQRDVLEAKNHERQLQLMDREAAQAAQKQVIISESEVETAQLSNTRAAIRDQGNLAGASQWIVDFCKFTRPGITWLIMGTVEISVVYMLLSPDYPAFDVASFFAFHAPILEIILGFWFAGRVLERGPNTA